MEFVVDKYLWCKYVMFKIVEEFERAIADFYGAPFAVSTDSCTHAIELALRYQCIKSTTCPAQTYVSIPMTLEKLGLDWSFTNTEWADYYYLGGTNIIDAAVYWKQNGYITNTMMCLSFQFKKHLNLVKGGAILVDNEQDYITLKKMSFDGRMPGNDWKQQDIDTLGYHYYMPIDTASLGLERLPQAIATIPRQWVSQEYPYLPNMKVFKK
jgi:dTDP-4-amino-4,6-dideoxygalactose transaminase